MAAKPAMTQRVLIKPRRIDRTAGGVLLDITPEKAGWELVHFRVRRIAAGRQLKIKTHEEECALVLLSGHGELIIDGEGRQPFGPRRSVFDSYPHAAYLPA